MAEEDASKSFIKYTNSFDAKDGIASSEDIVAERKKKREEFEARKKKRKEASRARISKQIAHNDEKIRKAAEKQLEEEKKRAEEERVRARKQQQEKAEEERRRQQQKAEEENRRRLYEQQKSSTLAVLDKDFLNAENLIKDLNREWLVNFKAIKTEWVRNNVKSDFLSKNQLAAIADVSHNCLLRARAGSGKTTVIKQKIDLLLKKTTIQPNQILALAFNRSAADEIKRKIQRDFNHLDFLTSFTFHSLAHRIVIPEKDILSGIEKSLHIESLLKSEINPSVITDIYEFFRREMAEIDNLGSLLSKSDYYQMRRAATYQTLKNDQVKSKGEKWIADFLFEHDIRYVYERAWVVDAKNKAGNYHPDFSIAVQGRWTDVVLEHWGIDELSDDRKVPEYWSKTWGQYHLDMKWKRNFWRDYNKKNPEKPIVFIETSIRDMKNGREAFEAILKQKLKNINVSPEKLPEAILREKVVRDQIPRLTKSLETFIGRAKKACLTSSALDKKLDSFQFSCEKEEVFVKLAARIYRRYQHSLTSESRMDYDDLMGKAVEKINQKRGEISFQAGDQVNISLNEIKWIMIDEYQDFSQLFYNMIDVIRHYNPSVKLFCVGDNWQAINGFAGSDLKFFNNFDDYFKDAVVLDLPDNYRSQRNIVEQANAFMKDKDGVPSITKSTQFDVKPVYKYHANDVYINYDNRDPEKKHEIYKTRVFSKGQWVNADPTFKMARLLMICQKIIKEHPLDTTTFMIVSRTGNLHYAYKKLEDFKSKLRKILQSDMNKFNNFDRQIQCLTAHGSKGLEADVVIVLNADERKFPLIHPDNSLNRILGVELEDVFWEEERLFYVAVTRARQELYFLTEKNRESEFLKKIALELLHMPAKSSSEKIIDRYQLPDHDLKAFDDDIPF